MKAPQPLREFLDRLRWWLCMRLMPPLALARERRRLEAIARESGASKSVACGIASAYFKSLKDR